MILYDLAIWHGDFPFQTASNDQRVFSKWMRVKMGCTQTNGRPSVLGIHDVLNHQIWGHSIFKQIHVQYLFIELFWCFSSSKDNPFTTGCWHLLIHIRTGPGTPTQGWNFGSISSRSPVPKDLGPGGLEIPASKNANGTKKKWGNHGETKKLGTSVTGEPWWSWWNADSRGSFWSMYQKHILFTISREFVGTRFVQKKYATAQRPRRLQNTKGKNWPSWTKYIKIQHVVQFGTELYWTIPFSALTPFLMPCQFPRRDFRRFSGMGFALLEHQQRLALFKGEGVGKLPLEVFQLFSQGQYASCSMMFDVNHINKSLLTIIHHIWEHIMIVCCSY